MENCAIMNESTTEAASQMEGIDELTGLESSNSMEKGELHALQPSQEVNTQNLHALQGEGPSCVPPSIAVKVGLIQLISNKPYFCKDLIQQTKPLVPPKSTESPPFESAQFVLQPFDIRKKFHTFKDFTPTVQPEGRVFELTTPRVPSAAMNSPVDKTKKYSSKDLSQKAVSEEKGALEMAPLQFAFKGKSSSHHPRTETVHKASDNVPSINTPSNPLSPEEQQEMRRLELQALTFCTQVREALSTTERVEVCDLARICDKLYQLEAMELPRVILLKEPLIVQTIYQLTRNPSLTKADTRTAVPHSLSGFDELNERVESVMTQIQGTIFNQEFESMEEFLCEYRKEVMNLVTDSKILKKTLLHCFGINDLEEFDDDPETYHPYPSDDETEVPAHLVPTNYHNWWVNVWKRHHNKEPVDSESE